MTIFIQYSIPDIIITVIVILREGREGDGVSTMITVIRVVEKAVGGGEGVLPGVAPQHCGGVVVVQFPAAGPLAIPSGGFVPVADILDKAELASLYVRR